MLSENVGGIPQTVVTSGTGDGMLGGGGLGGFILGLLFGGRGFGGFGGYAGAEIANTDNTIWTAQNFSRLENGQTALSNAVAQVGQGICSSTFALNDSIKDGNYATTIALKDGFYGIGNGISQSTFGITSAINSLAAQNAQCCCETLRAIDTVNYNAAINTCNIEKAITTGTQAILDKMCDNQTQTLRDENLFLKLSACGCR